MKRNITGLRYDLSIKELRYMLCKKKICPKCQGTLSRITNSRIVSGEEFVNHTDPFFTSADQVKYFRPVFICSSCKQRFELGELIEGN